MSDSRAFLGVGLGVLLTVVGSSPAGAQVRSSKAELARRDLRAKAPSLFESAADEFGVPADLLRAYAFVHTHWANTHLERSERDGHMPVIYGIMGLHDGRDGWFIDQIGRAALLLGVPADEIKNDPQTNVRAAAALLAEEGRKSRLEGKGLESWARAVERMSAIPVHGPVDRFARKSESFEVLMTLVRGYQDYGIAIPRRDLKLDRAFTPDDLRLLQAPQVSPDAIDSWDKTAAPDAGADAMQTSVTNPPDYPSALWNPTTCFDSRNGTAITHVAIHVMDGYYAGTISWFKNCANSVSSHYLVRSSDGQVTQMVREADMAWHVRATANPYTVGIENEGQTNDPSWYTDAMYNSSAAITRNVCDRLGIDRTKVYGGTYQGPLPDSDYTVKGHVHFANQTHIDPGSVWDWARFRTAVAPSVQDAADILIAESTIPTSFTVGETRSVTVKVRNTGSATWPAGGTVRLGALSDNTLPWSGLTCGGYANGPTDARAFLCSSVPPGGTYNFTFNVTAPIAAGTSRFAVRMVHDGVAWFSAGAGWSIPVTTPDAGLGITYHAHVQNIGWQAWVANWSGIPTSNDALAGTTGQSLRIEALQASLQKPTGSTSTAHVCYQAHVENIGWQAAVCDGAVAGTTGQSLRVEAVKFWLTNAAPNTRVCYRGYVQNIGWQGEVCNGATAGTTGQNLRLEAFQMRVLP